MNGRVVELGASVIFSGNRLAVEMINGHSDIINNNQDDSDKSYNYDNQTSMRMISPPIQPGLVFNGIGIYNGKTNDDEKGKSRKPSSSSWPFLTSNMTSDDFSFLHYFNIMFIIIIICRKRRWWWCCFECSQRLTMVVSVQIHHRKSCFVISSCVCLHPSLQY